MSRFPSEPTDDASSSLPETIPLPPRFRVIRASQQSLISAADQERLSSSAKEQLLRGKQLLLQLKELNQSPQSEKLQPTLATLSLAMHALQQADQSTVPLDEIRIVLDKVTHDLNELSQDYRVEQMYAGRWEQLAEWIALAPFQAEWSIEPIRELVKQLQREYLHHAPALHWYHGSPSEPAGWAAAHGLNTAQVLLRMLVRPDALSQELHNALLGGLLHDMGMAILPAKVLAAQEAVTPTMRQQWRQHPVWAADRLRSALHPDEFEVAGAIAHHHERLDGSGYPHRLKHEALDSLSRQLAVADAYAALCQPRPHRAAFSARTTVHMLLEEARSGRLDPTVVLQLLPWGVAPVGSVVELSDGTLAEVAAWGASSSRRFDARPVLLPYGKRHEATIDLEQARHRHIVGVLSESEVQEYHQRRMMQAS